MTLGRSLNLQEPFFLWESEARAVRTPPCTRVSDPTAAQTSWMRLVCPRGQVSAMGMGPMGFDADLTTS